MSNADRPAPRRKNSAEFKARAITAIARTVHLYGLCHWDGGTWHDVVKSGYQCECFEYAKLALKALRKAEIVNG